MQFIALILSQILDTTSWLVILACWASLFITFFQQSWDYLKIIHNVHNHLMIYMVGGQRHPSGKHVFEHFTYSKQNHNVRSRCSMMVVSFTGTPAPISHFISGFSLALILSSPLFIFLLQQLISPPGLALRSLGIPLSPKSSVLSVYPHFIRVVLKNAGFKCNSLLLSATHWHVSLSRWVCCR